MLKINIIALLKCGYIFPFLNITEFTLTKTSFDNNFALTCSSRVILESSSYLIISSLTVFGEEAV